MSQFIKDSLKGISLEAIAFQHGRTMLKELCDATIDFRARTTSGKQFSTAVEAIIKKHTNISVAFTLEDSEIHNAYVFLPGLDINHPFYNEYDKATRQSASDWLARDAIALFKKKMATVGWVDLNKGTVHGAFELITVKIFMTNFFVDDRNYTEEEVSSIILHELGHAFTTFEYLGESLVDNLSLATLIKQMAGQRDIPRKIQLLEKARTELGLKDLEVDKAAQATDEELCSIVVAAKAKDIRNSAKAKLYTETGAEFVADQFTTRHGGGRAIVTALDKVSREYGDVDHYTKKERTGLDIQHILIGLLSAVFVGVGFMVPMIPFIVIGFLIMTGIIITIFTNPGHGRYDRTTERYKRIRNDYVNALKDPKLSRDHRIAVLADIAKIDEVTKNMSPFYSVWERLGLWLFSSHQKELDMRGLEKQLESLGTNDLFIKAAEFKTV